WRAGKGEVAAEWERSWWGAGGSLTTVMRASATAAASRGEGASFAPAATRESVREAVRFQTTSRKPALRRLWLMGSPMRPTPMNPTVGCDTRGLRKRKERL